MSDSTSRRDPHRETLELLPWVVNETLEGEARRRVEDHLASCGDCAAELEASRALAATLAAAAPEASPHPAQLERLLARLDKEGDGAAARRPRLARSFAALPPPWRWAVAAQAALLAAALAVVLPVTGPVTDPAPATAPATAPAASFRTLGDATGGAADDGRQRLRLLFDPTLEEAELRRLLLAVDGELVGGPTPLGVYTVALSATPREPLEVVLAYLRQQPTVRFCEPIGAAGGAPSTGGGAP